MIINTSKVSLDKAADIIISYVKSNKKQVGKDYENTKSSIKRF